MCEIQLTGFLQILEFPFLRMVMQKGRKGKREDPGMFLHIPGPEKGIYRKSFVYLLFTYSAIFIPARRPELYARPEQVPPTS